ncbi:thiol peroxidase [Secundilactobacillus mixtipabuli]|jgi:thiol peroxidase|uniref:Thiol peroxidase n=1 Tax=Secundilactobacillus mixtipabuli TaxID=1435342 RepID=A0A1Z5IEY7_9LACO|nr:thiol peroxidase [Secundilactobacillus mixtipabuli]GAX00162.1 thiol peroxidase [Secundilactobacillus mixtipabuli]
MKVKFNGQDVELEGNPPQVGDQLPKFKLFNQNDEKVKMAQLLGKPLMLSIVPDLQTPVCSTQTHKFNQQADHYPNATFVTISNNTIAQQKNWCAAEGVINLQILSDEELSFGYATNLYLPNMGVLTRAILVTDAEGTITYEEIVPDVANEPDYLAALKALEKLTSRVDE